jgi:protein-L-isoaspartate(D-aspartate) O-methyltransferase
MVNTQLVPRGIRAAKVLAAFRKVPRELFVPASLRADAYADCALGIGEHQTISQPYMVAIMTELLNLSGNETVLEIGTGSGYQTAILCELAKKVFSMERIKILAEHARKTLTEIGYQNFEIMVGNGVNGLTRAAPFDRILITAAAPKIPPPLLDQLKEGGRLIAPLGETYFQTLTIADKINGKIKLQESLGCVFVPLIEKD